MANDDKKQRIADTSLGQLPRKELMTELYNRGYSVQDVMNEIKNIEFETKKNVETARESKFTGPEVEAMANMDVRKKDVASKLLESKGGSITKNRIGGNDYRKGGYVLSTVDNRKKK